ncbi:MAG: mechanosensitive ion channel family protein, partial [Bacteroidales bacterium]|nr:mechanosensitive ion channel family protein [Bacteroidales bacterium]
MKKVFVFLFVCLLTVFQAHAVLNERNLAKTLGVLRAELEQTYNQEQLSLEKFKKMNQEQHTNLIMMMQQSNQIALMLYSQNEDFTLDMAYACEAATEQYHKLMHRHLPYAQVKERMKSEILRYEELIKSLQDLPPRVDIDGQLLRIPDSIKRNRGLVDTVKLALSLLDEEGMLDRAACLKYAIFLRDNYKKMLEMVVQDEEHYIHVTKRVKELYDYAMARYEKIQRNIFVNGGENYFTVLKKFKIYAVQAKRDADEKYKPLTEKSDWRGPVIL